jgi:hypothetical protein
MSAEGEFTNSLFESKWWLDAVAPGNWHEILIEDHGRVLARLPVVIKGNGIGIPKYTQTIGIWFSDEILKNDANLNRQKDLIAQIIEKFPPSGDIKIYLDPSNRYFMPFYWAGFQIVPKITYQINSLSDLAKVYASFSANTRRDIKLATKKVQVRQSDDIEYLITLVLNNYGRQNRAYVVKPDIIRNIYSSAKFNNACRLLAATDEIDQVHSMALLIYDSRSCYYLLAGSEPHLNSKSCANSLIVWEGIKFASTVSRVFDFEGSMVKGIENFFRKFGSVPVVYYEVRRQGLFTRVFEILKPGVKKLLGHKK